MSTNHVPRTGARVTAAPSCCGCCGHPLTLHSNGRTACRAAGCRSGPEGGACPGFSSAAAVIEVPELLAS
jgi:hypothetical protein